MPARLSASIARPLRTPQPWWLDNGPLTPGDFGVEMPTEAEVQRGPDDAGQGVAAHGCQQVGIIRHVRQVRLVRHVRQGEPERRIQMLGDFEAIATIAGEETPTAF